MTYRGACGVTNCWRCLFGALDDMEDRMECECGETIRELIAERDGLVALLSESEAVRAEQAKTIAVLLARLEPQNLISPRPNDISNESS